METKSAEAVDFTLPSLGSDMEEATIITWLVDVGDQVSKGDVLVRVDTEKAEIDVEVWHKAVVVELLVAPGQTVRVGTPIARLGTESSGATSPVAKPASQAEAPKAEVDSAPIAPMPSQHVNPTRNGEAGVEVTPRTVYWPVEPTQTAPTQTGSTPAESTQTAPTRTAPTQTRAQRRQAAVAALMDRSNREIPHFHLVRQIDMAAAMAWLANYNEAKPPTERMLPAAILLHGVATAAAGSAINGTYVDGPVDATDVDLAIAVHVRGGGLMTPVLPAANAKTLDELMGDLQAVVGRARANRLNATDMTAASLTVTNLGDAGADEVLGVIRPPERALVGFGRITERACAVDGAVVVRPTVEVTLSADHRVVNGHAGARFLDSLADVLSDPTEFTLAKGDA